MLFDLSDDDVPYRALIARDPAYDGLAFVGVKISVFYSSITHQYAH
ncbi:hypothetical protein [Rouxiella sp. S1S-2]|nr:hypothetical protein [Rouxiella sp. S1S-2]